MGSHRELIDIRFGYLEISGTVVRMDANTHAELYQIHKILFFCVFSFIHIMFFMFFLFSFLLFEFRYNTFLLHTLTQFNLILTFSYKAMSTLGTYTQSYDDFIFHLKNSISSCFIYVRHFNYCHMITISLFSRIHLLLLAFRRFFFFIVFFIFCFWYFVFFLPGKLSTFTIISGFSLQFKGNGGEILLSI